MLLISILLCLPENTVDKLNEGKYLTLDFKVNEIINYLHILKMS